MTNSHRALPPYALRVSPRARNVRLVIAPGKGLTLVVPPGFDASLAPGIVAGRLDWVNRHLERIASMPEPERLPPSSVELRAVERVLAVRYRAGDAASVSVRPAGPSSLCVSGGIACRDSVARALRAWLKREAARELGGMLHVMAARTGLGYSGLTVRLQRSRWGSCSARGGVSLNARLLFLPPELCSYVLAHELAHTVHLNHSPEYWSFLEEIMPEARLLDGRLRSARRYVPWWALG